MSEHSSSRQDLSSREKQELDVEISFLEGLANRDPEYIEALQLLGDDYTKRGRFAEGLAVDEQLSRLLPEDSMVFYNLACSFSLTDRIDDSITALRKAVQLGYDDTKWMDKDPDLNKIRSDPRFEQIRHKLNLKCGTTKPPPRHEVTYQGPSRHYRTVWFDPARNRVRLIEQRLSRTNSKCLHCGLSRYRPRHHHMIVRGAGAMAPRRPTAWLRAHDLSGAWIKAFERHLAKVYRTLAEGRPTAVDPVSAMRGVYRK
ncbi:MAG: hypothetical protein CM1200mP29_07400 [Verrucomicrobiota bacterium]|nr:MAG: hypothetical protein CM1200mP29_07400 [Verrucomicrobiota bacterium]